MQYPFLFSFFLLLFFKKFSFNWVIIALHVVLVSVIQQHEIFLPCFSVLCSRKDLPSSLLVHFLIEKCGKIWAVWEFSADDLQVGQEDTV